MVQKRVLATEGAAQMDVQGIVARATAASPSGKSVKETIAGQLPSQQGEAVAAPVRTPSASPLVVPSEALLSIGESRDFAQAYSNWLMGEELSGRQFPEDDIHRSVRQGLADQLLGQRPGGMDSFAQFLSADKLRGE